MVLLKVAQKPRQCVHPWFRRSCVTLHFWGRSWHFSGCDVYSSERCLGANFCGRGVYCTRAIYNESLYGKWRALNCNTCSELFHLEQNHNKLSSAWCFNSVIHPRILTLFMQKFSFNLHITVCYTFLLIVQIFYHFSFDTCNLLSRSTVFLVVYHFHYLSIYGNKYNLVA